MRVQFRLALLLICLGSVRRSRTGQDEPLYGYVGLTVTEFWLAANVVPAGPNPTNTAPWSTRSALVGCNFKSSEQKLLYPVLVRGLGKFSGDDVKELFNDCGSVRCVRQSGDQKWLVYFADRASAALGQQLNGTEFEGNCIRCSILKPSFPPPAALVLKKKELTYSVVINNLPDRISLEQVQAAASKQGEVLRIKMDKKKKGAAWIEYKDKISARRLSRKGLQVDDVTCTAVRVRPILRSPESAAKRDEEARVSKKTLMVTNLPLGSDAIQLQEQLRHLFSRCGNVTQVRVSGWRGMGFVDFDTVTAMRKAKRLDWTLGGACLAVAACRHSIPLPRHEAHDTAWSKTRQLVRKPPSGCCTVLVKNLPYSASVNAVRKVFAGVGAVKEVRLLRRGGQTPPKAQAAGAGAVALMRGASAAGRRATGDKQRDEQGGGRDACESTRQVAGPEPWSGFAYVDFRNEECVARALRMQGAVLGGRRIRVDWAATSPRFRAGTRKHTAP